MSNKSPTARELFVEKASTPAVPPPDPGSLEGASIASTILYGLDSIKLLMILLRQDINTGKSGRDVTQSLKDCMASLFELQEREKDFLANLSEDELKKLVK